MSGILKASDFAALTSGFKRGGHSLTFEINNICVFIYSGFYNEVVDIWTRSLSVVMEENTLSTN